MHPLPDRCLVRYIIISPPEIHLLRFILEAYEGLGVVTTVDPGLGLVKLSIAPGCEPEVDRILEAEKGRLRVRSISMDADFSRLLDGNTACDT
ncbi:MAG: DUF4911 domain-containing protein [Acidobacteriota bacterium]